MKNVHILTKYIGWNIIQLAALIVAVLCVFKADIYAASYTVTSGTDFANGKYLNTESVSKEGELKLKADGLWTARIWKAPYVTLNDGSIIASDDNYTYLIAARDQKFMQYLPDEDKWKDLAVAPHMPSSGADMVVLGDNIYVIWGGYQRFFSKYNIPTNTWSELSLLPDYIYTGASIETDGSNLFILRGAGTIDFWKYNVSGASWTTLSSTPATISGGAELLFDNSTGTDYLYTPRGASQVTFYRYDIGANTWTTRANITASFSTSGNAAKKNGILYFMRGGNTATFYSYNVSTNTWSTLTNAPGNSQYVGLVYNSHEDYFYVFQGNNTLNWWKFNEDVGATGTFIGPTDLPNTPGTGADLVYASGNVYFRRGNSSNLFYKFDTSTNAWTTANTAPAAFADDNKGIRAGNYLYFYRGSNTNAFYRYDTGTNAWFVAGTTPSGAGVNHGASLAYDGTSDYIYGTRGGNTTAFWRYSISGNTWSDAAVADMPTDNESGYGARLVSDGTNVFALTGNGIGRFLKYTIATDTWSDLGALPFAPYYGTDIVHYNGKFYAQAGTYKTSVWEYTVVTNTWRQLGDLPGYYVQGIGPYNGGSLAADYTNGVLYSINGANQLRFLSFTVSSNPYPTSGTWTSEPIDLTYVSSFGNLTGSTLASGNSSITFATRTSSDKVTWNGWQNVINSVISSSTARYLQIKATLNATSDQSASPVLYSLNFTYQGDTTPPSNPSSVTGKSQELNGVNLVSGTGTSYKHTNPYFSWSGASDLESTVSGYYVYFGTGSTANPQTEGSYQTTSTYNVTSPMSAGTYYLRIQTKDAAGNISDASTGFIYQYSGVPSVLGEYSSTSDFVGTTDNVVVTGDQIRLQNSAGFWRQQRLSVIPAGVSYGASFAYIASSNKLYTFRGNNTTTFYEYDIATDTWTALANAPAVVQAGGELVEGPSGYLYGAPGRSLTTFWRYDISSNTWSDGDAADAPSPFYYGSSMVFDNERYIYSLRGNSDDAFMRYDTQNDSWESLANADFGQPEKTPNNNVYIGGDLAIDHANNTIYAIQGNAMPGFAKYDMATNTWTPLDNVPLLPYNGAQIDYDADSNALFFTPGYGTPFFYKYDLAQQEWIKLGDAPATIAEGSSIEVVNGIAYILRGGGTQTFWKYIIDSASWQVPNLGLFGVDFRTTDYKTIGTGGNIVKGDGNNYYLVRGNVDTQFVRYDSVSGTTTTLAEAPASFSTGSVLAYDGNNTIYAITSNLVKRLYKYSISTDTWTEAISDPPPVDVNTGASMTYDGSRYIYLAPGSSTSFYRFDTDSGTSDGSRWLARANITAALGTGGEIVYKDGYVYAQRGSNTLSFYRYDPGANTWSDPLAADLPAGALMNTDSFLVDGGSAALLACRGGNITGTSSLSICYNYDIGTTRWSAIANPPANINQGGAAASNGTDRVFMIAGNGTNTYANGIYSYVIPTTTSSFVSSGSYISPVHDLSSNYEFANITINYTSAANTSLSVYTRTSADDNTWSAWADATEVKTTSSNYIYKVNSPAERYIQIKFTMTSDGISSGVINSYAINHFEDTVAPSNPTEIHAYLDNTQSVGLTTNTWYSSTAPYFSWPDEDTTGGATDGVNGSGVAGYYVYLGIGDTADPANLGTYTTAPFYQSSSLLSGYTYYLRIKTKDNAGKVSSAIWTPFVYKPDTTRPSNPTTLNVNPPTWSNATSYDFSWSGASDANSGIAEYCYKNGLAGAETCTSSTTVSGVTPYSTGELTFFIRTKDNAGNYASDYAPITYKHTTTAPTAPENLEVGPTASTKNEFSFTWEPPLIYSGPQSSLKYYYSVNVPPTADNIQPSIGLSVSYLTSSNYATQNGTNRMYVVAKDEAGNIDYGNAAYVDFRVDTSSPTVPQKMDIADLSVKDQESWKLALSWEPPESTGSGVARYEVYRSVDEGASCTDDFTKFEEIASTGQNNKSYVDVNLEQETYYYCVQACTSTNVCSDPSETVSMLPDGKWEVPPDLTSEPEATVKTRTATIAWVTNRKANSFVKFGKSAGDYGEEVGSSETVTDHEIDLNTLDPGTTYYYKVLWTDEDGNLGESDEYSFTTESAPFVSSVKFSHVSLNEAFVEFTIKSAVKASVQYGKTTAYGAVETTSTSKAESSYTVILKNLIDGTAYHVRIVAEDNEGNTYNGDDYSFQTLPVPKLGNVKVQQVVGMPTATLRLLWASNTRLTSVVTYYPSSNPQLTKDAINLTPKTQHEIIIQDLIDETDYTFVIKGKDSAGNSAKSEVRTLKTATDLRPPEIVNSNVETTIVGVGEDARAQIIVTWDSDEPSTSQVEYGEGTSGQYTSSTQEDGTLAKNHSMTIPGLSPSKIYHFRITSKDKNKNKGLSQDIVVITPNATKDALNLVVNKLSKTFSFLKKTPLK